MPSRPVLAPNRITRLPTPVARASLIPSRRMTPTHSALTSGLPTYDRSKSTSPPMFGKPRQLPYPPMPATTPGSIRPVSRAVAGPNRNESITATGRAPVADIDHAGVLPDADEQRVARGCLFGDLAQVHLRRLVGAMLAPHDRIHGQFGCGRPAAENRANAAVLVLLQPKLVVRLSPSRVGLRDLDRVDRHRWTATSVRPSVTLGDPASPVKKGRPSRPEPVSGSTACSGCGMRPTTFPTSLQTPAISRKLPFGLPPR